MLFNCESGGVVISVVMGFTISQPTPNELNIVRHLLVCLSVRTLLCTIFYLDLY